MARSLLEFVEFVASAGAGVVVASCSSGGDCVAVASSDGGELAVPGEDCCAARSSHRF